MGARVAEQARRVAALAVCALAMAAAAGPATAGAATHGARNAHGRFLGVVHAKSATPRLFAQRHAATAALVYHGGPVVRAQHVYSIFWVPPGYSIPSDYRAGIDRYFADVAADSGKRTNVYSAAAQYADSSGGRANYDVSYDGSFLDTAAFPASDCTDTGASPCLTDSQLNTQLAAFIAAHSLPTGMSTLYFVFTPPNVGSCFDSSSTECAFDLYCGYHSSASASASAGGTILYANEPFVPNTAGCDSGASPSGTSADATLNVVSHEQNEIATDPLGDAWFTDTDGEENGDLCSFDFGSTALTGAGQEFNQTIHGSTYLLQREWSNADGGCVASTSNMPPHAAFTYTGTLQARHAVAFDGAGSSDPDGTVRSYAWDFGDGATATGPQVSHAYAAPGTYSVSLTVTDDEAATATGGQTVVVGPDGSTATGSGTPTTSISGSSAAQQQAARQAAKKKHHHKKKHHKKRKKHRHEKKKKAKRR